MIDPLGRSVPADRSARRNRLINLIALWLMLADDPIIHRIGPARHYFQNRAERDARRLQALGDKGR